MIVRNNACRHTLKYPSGARS
ncbi:hypothetical protein GJ700_05410 [Duganella sp. FT92W]|uniref:Uncharacterized protein n=1 Tax=Pseudoduganella rivuli TaxID=2666085 RepID=A0A7X2IJU4_9BURK|nr:hypothetical protein [Pseudoduganella rivuli]